jgi:hypothetical protein
METLPRIALSRTEVMKRVARFKDLKGFDGGLPDSKMPGCERTLYNVIGFQPPKGEGGAVTSPVGDDAAQLAAIKISEGFNLGYCRAKPGHGPMMHNRRLYLDTPGHITTPTTRSALTAVGLVAYQPRQFRTRGDTPRQAILLPPGASR